MSGENPGRNIEKEDARARSVKEPKGAELVDATMDDEMEDKGSKLGEEEPGARKSDGIKLTGNCTGKGRKLVSYLDKVLCLNGEGNVFDNEEEDWMETQRREEEEEDMLDDVGSGVEDDPLCPTYVFSRKQHKEDCKKWRNALIIKLMGKKMASRFLMARLQRLWNLISTYEMTDLDNGHLLLKFKDERDFSHVLQEGPWIVADHYVIVQRWRPFFDPYNEEVKKLAVWIRIPGLPTEFYTMQHLWRIGNMLGRTLKVEKTLLRRMEGVEGEITGKARFARIYVEVDLRRSFVSRFKLWDFIQKEFIYLNVGYEGLHLICFDFGRYGHRRDACDGGRDYAKELSKVEVNKREDQGNKEVENTLDKGSDHGSAIMEEELPKEA